MEKEMEVKRNEQKAEEVGEMQYFIILSEQGT